MEKNKYLELEIKISKIRNGQYEKELEKFEKIEEILRINNNHCE